MILIKKGEYMVSVIVPVYNVEEYLDECISSIIAQTENSIQIILVDDGSKDHSGEICDRYAETDDRIVVIHQENNGVSAARNAGIEQVAGEWIMFVDADDFIEYDALESLLSIPENKKYDIISGDYYRDINEKKSFYDYKQEYDLEQYRELFFGLCVSGNSAGGLLPKEIKKAPPMMFPWLKLYKTDLIKSNNILFPVGQKSAEDQVFNLRVISAAKKIYYINKPIYYYRKRFGSASNNGDALRMEYLKGLRAVEETFTKYNISVDKRFWGYGRVQNIWHLAQLYAQTAETIPELWKFRKKLSGFIKEKENTNAVLDTQLAAIDKLTHRVMVFLLKIHAYILLLILCKLYYRRNQAYE